MVYPEGSSEPVCVLVAFRSGNIGSTLVSLPTLRALLASFGRDVQPTILYRDGSAAHDAAREILTTTLPSAQFELWPDSDLIGLARLCFRLRRRGFTAAAVVDEFVLTRRKAWKYRLFFLAAGVTRCFGLQPRQTTKRNTGGPYPHIAQARLEQLARDGIDIPDEYWKLTPSLAVPAAVRQSAGTWLEAQRAQPHRPLLALCPGARSSANHWGFDRFLELGRRLLALEHYELVVCGGPTEHALGSELVKAWGRGINAAGCLSVLESAALFSACDFMVGLDTGTTHLAAAVGTRCIMLQGGRTLPGNWVPLGEGHIVLRYPVACAGCGLPRCPLSRHPCMRGLTVEDAWQAVLKQHLRATGIPGSGPGLA